MQKKKLTAAIAGYGKMGKIREATLQSHPDTEVGLIFDPGLSSLENPGHKCCSSFDDLIRTDCDMVFIAGYVSNAADYTVRALRAGKHVFCEKPPALSVEEMKSVKSALESSGKILKYGFNHRYHNSVIKAKQIVDSGSIGNIILMRAVYGKAGSIDFKENWRNYKEFSGGGILMDQGIHMLDLFNYFSGTELGVRYASVKTLHWQIECEDNAFVILESDKNLVCTLHSSATQWTHKFLLEIIGDNGFVTLDGILSPTMSYAPETVVFGYRGPADKRSKLERPSQTVSAYELDNSWELELDEFVCAIRGEGEIRHGTFAQARASLRQVEEAYSFKE